jgi:hypothetical protein
VNDDSILARARASLEDKRRRGGYLPELLDALAEPLDLRPDPEVAAGPAWGEAVATAEVSVGPPPPSSRPGLGPAVTALKRAVERGLRWYLPPVVAQVTRHNRAVLEVLAEHNRHIVELRREVEQLQSRIAALDSSAPRSDRPR